MNDKWYKTLALAFMLSVIGKHIYAQQSVEKVITVDELFKMVKDNHPTLKPLKVDIDIAKQNLAVAKNDFLPDISTGIQAYYLGNTNLIEKDFSGSTKVNNPNFGNKFFIDAQQVIWKGNSIRNNIQSKALIEQLTKLNYTANEQNIKLLSIGYYLDLYKFLNQENVYRKNIELAKQRLENINKFYNQGMVTRNDVVRGELQLSNLKLDLQVLLNDRQIINRELTTALGLSAKTVIMPDTTLVNQVVNVTDFGYYEDISKRHPTLEMARKNVDVYVLSTKITKAEMLPTLRAFAGNNLQRPLSGGTSPGIDLYTHTWSAGLSLNFNIDALYKAPKKIRLNNLEKERAIAESYQNEQMINVEVNSAYIKFNEAKFQNSTLEVNTKLTEENYRIMESKYNNQLAILLDLIDASNAKLEAELQFANSEINIIYTYYKLLKEAGQL